MLAVIALSSSSYCFIICSQMSVRPELKLIFISSGHLPSNFIICTGLFFKSFLPIGCPKLSNTNRISKQNSREYQLYLLHLNNFTIFYNIGKRGFVGEQSNKFGWIFWRYKQLFQMGRKRAEQKQDSQNSNSQSFQNKEHQSIFKKRLTSIKSISRKRIKRSNHTKSIRQINKLPQSNDPLVNLNPNQPRQNQQKEQRQAQILVQERAQLVNPVIKMVLCSEAQKTKQIQNYFAHGINEFYRPDLQDSELNFLSKFISDSTLQIPEIYQPEKHQLPVTETETSSFIHYLQTINTVKKYEGKYMLLKSQAFGRCYCCCYGESESHIFEITEIQLQLLGAREHYYSQTLEQIGLKFYEPLVDQGQVKNRVSELLAEAGFFCYTIYKKSKELAYYCQNIVEKHESGRKERMDQQSSRIIKSSQIIEDEYLETHVKRLMITAVQEEEMDFNNYFRERSNFEQQKQQKEQQISEKSQFLHYIKRTKNIKGTRFYPVLATACLGCCSNYYEQHNIIDYCQICYVRYHRICYKPFRCFDNKSGKEVLLCEKCYRNKKKRNHKEAKQKQKQQQQQPQCNFCGVTGFLSISFGNSQRIHIFCMLMNGLWKIDGHKIVYGYGPATDWSRATQITEGKKKGKRICKLCRHFNPRVYSCTVCQSLAHPFCAFIAGWKFQLEFPNNSAHLKQLSYQCCGVDLKNNSTKRRFKTNHNNNVLNMK